MNKILVAYFSASGTTAPVAKELAQAALSFRWSSHLAVEVPGENGSNEWLEPVDNTQYGELR